MVIASSPARIRPFRGYRYRIGTARDLSRVVAPPYDQISHETQERLYAMSPENIVRVTYAKDEPGADPYRRARETLDRWVAAGVWSREAQPGIYPYHQTYAVSGRRITRTGFVALGDVTEYSAGIVRPHGKTHAGPKQDRLRLLEATRADTGLIFMLMADPGGGLLEATAPAGEPVAEARDLKGELHRLWRVTDGAVIARVQALMADRSVIIADGHHRYETAVEYARRYPGTDTKLMALFTLEAPGLTILANHRLVHHVARFSLDPLVPAARRWFDVTSRAAPGALPPTS